MLLVQQSDSSGSTATSLLLGPDDLPQVKEERNRLAATRSKKLRARACPVSPVVSYRHYTKSNEQSAVATLRYSIIDIILIV